MSERVAIVHIGTHKTGTTSLQLFFEANRPAFQGSGVWVAQGGRYQRLPGNHQVAWELLSSNDSPHFDELTTELRSLRERTALITSEDFCLLYARPEALDHLRAGIEAAGFTPVIVVYLRAQAPYAESMYVERIKHDYVRPFRGYLDRILHDGLYVPDGSPIHIEFEFTRLLAPFVNAFGRERVVVRPYVSAGDSLNIFRDFLAVLAAIDPVSNQSTQLSVPDPRANDSLSFHALLEAAHRALEAHRTTGHTLLEEIHALAPATTGELLSSRVRLLQREEFETLCDRFASDNRRLEAEFGIALHGAERDAIAPPDDAGWKLARAQRDLFDRLLDRWLKRRAADPLPPK